MARHPVSIFTDWTPPRPSAHSAVWVPPPPPPVPSYPHAELPVPLGWPSGSASHKFTSSVFHQGFPIAKDGHDCGLGITHLTFPPHDPLLIFHTLASSRKIMFGASTVKMNGDPTGIVDVTKLCVMLMCAEPVSLPIQGVFTNGSNNVYVGAITGDYVAGAAAIISTMALDFVVGKFGDALKGGSKELLVDVIVKEITRNLKLLIGYGASSAQGQFASDGGVSASVPTSNTPATATTSSPFGESSVTVSPNSDGSFSAHTSSPTSSGRRTETASHGLGLAGPTEQAAASGDLEEVFAQAPVL